MIFNKNLHKKNTRLQVCTRLLELKRVVTEAGFKKNGCKSLGVEVSGLRKQQEKTISNKGRQLHTTTCKRQTLKFWQQCRTHCKFWQQSRTEITQFIKYTKNFDTC